MPAWLGVESLRGGHATSIGAAPGAIAGLVAITPACGAVTPIGALAVGAVAGAVCPFAFGLKERFGTVLIGVLATADAPSGKDGLLHGGRLHLLGVQWVRRSR